MATVSLALDTPALAETYERVSAERQFRAGQRLIEELNVTSGEAVLDIGSGTGLVAEYVADLVGPNGSVVGIDPLPLRIALAERKSQPNLRFLRTGCEDFALRCWRVQAARSWMTCSMERSAL